MKSFFLIVALVCGSSFAIGQPFEAAISGGPNNISKSGSLISASLSGVPGAGDTVSLDTSGWNLGFRMTVNPYSRIGFELGYIYNRTHLFVGSQDAGGMAIHQGFVDGLGYLTKEGSRFRPFGAAGINFSNFVIPGASSQYGQGENKFGFNYGAGIKVKVKGMWMIRGDVRQFNQGKPNFGISGVSGRLLLTQYSVGVGVGI
jgi:opacity protein-like surface antigen